MACRPRDSQVAPTCVEGGVRVRVRVYVLRIVDANSRMLQVRVKMLVFANNLTSRWLNIEVVDSSGSSLAVRMLHSSSGLT